MSSVPGNSCRGDGDRDRILSEVQCWWNPVGMKPGPWPNGNCIPKTDPSCVNLGVTSPQCVLVEKQLIRLLEVAVCDAELE